MPGRIISSQDEILVVPRKPDLLPDWFLGGAGKRRLLRGLCDPDRTAEPWTSPQPWTEAALAATAGVHGKHTVFRHLEILVLAGLLEPEGQGFKLNGNSPLLKPIRELTIALDGLSPVPLPPSRGGG